MKRLIAGLAVLFLGLGVVGAQTTETTLEVTATGTPQTCSIDPAIVTYAFGDVMVGVPSTLSATLTNIGLVTCVVEGTLTITPTPAMPEEIVVVIVKTTIAPTETTDVEVTITPAVVGPITWSVKWNWVPVP